MEKLSIEKPIIVWDDKEKETDQVWWGSKGYIHDGVFLPYDGVHLFSFDKVKIYNYFRDYPHALTPEEKEIFDRENPFWADKRLKEGVDEEERASYLAELIKEESR